MSHAYVLSYWGGTNPVSEEQQIVGVYTNEQLADEAKKNVITSYAQGKSLVNGITRKTEISSLFIQKFEMNKHTSIFGIGAGRTVEMKKCEECKKNEEFCVCEQCDECGKRTDHCDCELICEDCGNYEEECVCAEEEEGK